MIMSHIILNIHRRRLRMLLRSNIRMPTRARRLIATHIPLHFRSMHRSLVRIIPLMAKRKLIIVVSESHAQNSEVGVAVQEQQEHAEERHCQNVQNTIVDSFGIRRNDVAAF